MKKYIQAGMLFLFFLTAKAYAQTGNKHLFLPDYSEGRKGELTEKEFELTNDLLVHFDAAMTDDQKQEILVNSGIIRAGAFVSYINARLAMVYDCAGADRQLLLSHPAVKKVTEIYTADGIRISAQNILYFRPSVAGATEKVMDILKDYSARIVSTGKHEVVKVEFAPGYDPFELANLVHNSGLASFCEPFLYNFSAPLNDPYDNDQWYIKGATAGAVGNTKIDDAWGIAPNKGSGIVVAVIDDGVDLQHQDLAGRVAGGYSAIPDSEDTQSPPFMPGMHSPLRPNHGTPVAGIIVAADNNGLGITGVSYQSKVFSSRMAFTFPGPPAGPHPWMSSNVWIADAIDEAVYQGSHVINMSFRTTPSGLIDASLFHAAVSGRGGKGCVLVGASGNDSATTVSYPSVNINVVSVGASTKLDEKAGFSTYGVGLELVAPGVSISTLDISGPQNYDWNNDGLTPEDGGINSTGSGDYTTMNYTKKFSGTSAAAPVVAGVFALLLSNDPSLTRVDVVHIVNSTCTKPSMYSFTNQQGYPDGTRHEKVGYGRVNAHAAMLEVVGSGPPTAGWYPQITNVTVSNVNCYNPDNPPKVTYWVTGALPFSNNGSYWYSHGAGFTPGISSQQSNNGMIYANSQAPFASIQPGISTITLPVNEPTFPFSTVLHLQVGSDDPTSTNPFVTPLDIPIIIKGINVTLNNGIFRDTICYGQTYPLHLTLGGGTAPYMVLLQKKTPSNPSWIAVDTTLTPVVSNAVFSIGASHYERGANQYRFLIQDLASGCSRVSRVFTLDVGKPLINDYSFTACVHQDPVPLDMQVTGGLGAMTYTWSPATHLSSTTAAIPNFNPLQSGIFNYNVTVTDVYGCATSGQVIVNAAATTFSALVASPWQPLVCQGATVDLSAALFGGIPPMTYVWTDSNGVVLNPGGGLHIQQTVSGPETFLLTVTDAQNCKISSEANVWIDLSFGPQIDTTPLPPVCPGKLVTISPIISGPAPVHTYSWSPSDTSLVITNSSITSTSHTLTVTDVNDCFFTHQFDIIRDPALSGQISFTVVDPPICYNSQVLLQADITGGTAPYSWGADSLMVTTTVQNGQVTATDAAGCYSEADYTLQYPDKIMMTRYNPNNPNVAPDIEWWSNVGPGIFPNYFVCSGDLIDFGALYATHGGSLFGGVPPYTYDWSVKFDYFAPGNPSQQTMIVDLNQHSFPNFQFQTEENNNDYGFLPQNSLVNWIYLIVNVTDANGCQIDKTSPDLGDSSIHGMRVLTIHPQSGDFSIKYNFEQDLCHDKLIGSFIYDPGSIADINRTIGEIKITAVHSRMGAVSLTPVSGYGNDIFTQSYQFPYPGYYEITHVVSNACGGDTVTNVIYIAQIPQELQPNYSLCGGQNMNRFAQYVIKTQDQCYTPITMPAKGKHVEFVAGLEIDLNPGFESQPGAQFTARIQNCLQEMLGGRPAPVEDDIIAYLYPNPTSSTFTIDVRDRDTQEQEAITQINVYDMLGKLVYTFSGNITTHVVDISGQPAGVYNVRISAGGKLSVKRVVRN